jgi:murein L,D-transpeptidase YafK
MWELYLKYIYKITILILIQAFILPLAYAAIEQVPYEMINYLLDDDQSYDNVVIFVDKSKQDAFLYEVSRDSLHLRQLNQYKVTTGKNHGDKFKQGDKKTPEGFYIIEGEVSKWRLTPMYGYGAYPINYPNQIDKYLKKKGNSIWLHGTDKDITPYDTDGCIRFENEELRELSKKFNFKKTAVIINDTPRWVKTNELKKEAENLKQFLVDWEHAWESQDLTAYLQFYHADFYTENLKMSFESWARYKNRINKKRSNIQVEVKNQRYLYSNGYLLIEFDQVYKSANYSDLGKKSMLWKKEGENWLILREEWDGNVIPVRSTEFIDLDSQIPEASEELNHE